MQSYRCDTELKQEIKSYFTKPPEQEPIMTNTKSYGPDIWVRPVLSNPYGPRLWTDSHNRTDEIERLYPGYKVESINFDVCGYLYRLYVDQLSLDFI